ASRSALLSTLVAAAIIPATWTRLTRRQLITDIAWAATVMSGVAVLIPSVSLERLATTRTELIYGTMDTRTEIWKAGLEVFSSHPFAGVGAGGFERAVQPLLGYAGGDAHFVAHNTFLSILVE